MPLKKRNTKRQITIRRLAKHSIRKILFRRCQNAACKYCCESIAAVHSEYYIEPVNGFKTGITKESTRLKPRRSYAGEVSYLGQGKKDDSVFRLGQHISVETSSEDQLCY